MRRLSMVTGLFLTVTVAGIGVSQDSNESPTPDEAAAVRYTGRTLSQTLADAEWISVADGFVLRLYSDRQVEAYNQRRALQEKHRNEYLVKREPLDQRQNEISKELSLTRETSVVKSMFRRYDSDRDGIIEGDELTRIHSRDKINADGDSKITKAELMKYLLPLVNTSVRGARGSSDAQLPENWEKLVDEFQQLSGEIAMLDVEFGDASSAREFTNFYKVIEVGRDFIHIRLNDKDRIIPFASIVEFLRQNVEQDE